MSHYLKGTQGYVIVKLKLPTHTPRNSFLLLLGSLFYKVFRICSWYLFEGIHANISFHLYVHTCIYA